MGLILRYATKPSTFESGTVYECDKLKYGPPTLFVNVTNQVYEYQYKREVSKHNINAHQGNAMLQKVRGSDFIFVCFRKSVSSCSPDLHQCEKRIFPIYDVK